MRARAGVGTGSQPSSAGGQRVLVAHPGAELYGSDRVLLESVTGLVEEGWDVHVALPEGGPLVPELLAAGARVHRCPTLVLRKSLLRPAGLPGLVGGTVVGVLAAVRLLLRLRPARVYVSTVTVPLWTCVAGLWGTRVVVHVHEAEGSAPRWVRTLLAAPLLLADRLVVNSRFARDVVVGAVPALAARSVVVPNAVPGPPPPSAPPLDRRAPLRLLYVGRLSPRKGVDVAVEAVARLRDLGVEASLDVVGSVFPGYEWFEEQLRELVDGAGLGDRVVLHGFQDRVQPYLEAADVVLVPSRFDEPFGNTAVEGVLAARPVVASATSGLLEATEGYATARIVPPGDPVALAEALAALTREWSQVVGAVAGDAATARARHDPARYRARVVAEVAGHD